MPVPTLILTTNKSDDTKSSKVTSIPMKLTFKSEALLKHPIPAIKQEASMKLDKKPFMKQETSVKPTMKLASSMHIPLESGGHTIKSEPYTASTLKQSTAVAATMKLVTTSTEAEKPAYRQMKSAPTSPKSQSEPAKSEPVIKTNMKPNQIKSMSTLVKPAKLQLKQANEATNRKRLCSAEEVLAKRQHAIETRNRKRSEREEEEIEARNKILCENIMFAEKEKVEEILRQEE